MPFTPGYLSQTQRVVSFGKRAVFGPDEGARCRPRGPEPPVLGPPATPRCGQQAEVLSAGKV